MFSHLSKTFRDVIDIREFVRFVLTGVSATAGNMAMVAAIRNVLPYRFALVAGLLVGLVISFVMGKLFAFRSASPEHARGELARFLVVYLFGAALFWAAGMVVGLHLGPMIMPRRWAELAGVLAGASVMVVTSYFGHRWFTYAHLRAGRSA